VLFYVPFVSIVLFYVLFVSIVLFYVLFVLIVLFYVLFVSKCVLYFCHWVSTQLQLTNISYHIISNDLYNVSFTSKGGGEWGGGPIIAKWGPATVSQSIYMHPNWPIHHLQPLRLIFH